MSANEYARQRGRAVAAPASPTPAPRAGRKADPISAAEQARAAKMRAAVRAHIPEALPLIRELHELGMIDGWRNVETVEVFENP